MAQVATEREAIFALVEQGKAKEAADASRIAASRLDALNSQLTSIISRNQEAATAKQLELELVVEHSPMVEGDPLALKRVIDNLLSNAIKYSPPGRSVVLRVRQQGQDAVILVEDEGLGIPPGERDRLFVKFGRLSNKPTGGEHATGLGLSIVKELVESMGGWVDAANRPQQGAVFSVYLPVYTPKSTCDEA